MLLSVRTSWSGPASQILAQLFGRWLYWAIVLFGAIILFGLAAAVIRRMAMGISAKRPAGLTLEQLEELRRQGAVSEEEYQRMRRSVLGLTGTDKAKADAAGAGRPAPGSDEDRTEGEA